MGGLEKSQGHYYRIQGSTFVIEHHADARRREQQTAKAGKEASAQ
ncbi:MAG: hypothetical protein DMF78_12095 [Acidobacteria bacterium]|nr:MAG: hypothetical protein DMF78_12095 [Acidobacteriota bacterium]